MNEATVEHLTDIYYKYESWCEPKMDRDNALLYHRTLLDNGIIDCAYSDNGIVLGYVETWRITHEQLGRIICGESFSAMQEDVQRGQVAWLANIFVLPEHRNGRVIHELYRIFFTKYKDCTHYAGLKVKRSAAPFQIFTRDKLISARRF